MMYLSCTVPYNRLQVDFDRVLNSVKFDVGVTLEQQLIQMAYFINQIHQTFLRDCVKVSCLTGSLAAYF